LHELVGRKSKNASSAQALRRHQRELTGKFWENAVRNPFYSPVKRQLTLRLGADVIFWLRHGRAIRPA
jgi:uncharacterized protein (DUF4415 family)